VKCQVKTSINCNSSLLDFVRKNAELRLTVDIKH